MLKAPEIREKVLEKFIKNILPNLHENDQIIRSGYEQNNYIFHILTKQALFFFAGRWEGQVSNEQQLETCHLPDRAKAIIVDELFDDLIKVYQTDGTYLLPREYTWISACIIFPKLTKMSTSAEIHKFFNKFNTRPLQLKNYTNLNLNDIRKKMLTELKQIQENTCLETVKELLLELEPHDEVMLTEAIQVVKEEGNFTSLDEPTIEKALKVVAENLKEFKFVRLTRTIKRLDIQSSTLADEIDNLFKKFGDFKS